MKKSDLKQLIKPLVKECIHEVLLEEGLLSNVVAEVAKGMQGNLVVETRKQQPEQMFNENMQMKRKTDESRQKLKEHRKKLLDAVGTDAYNGVNLFEGTEALTTAAKPASWAHPRRRPIWEILAMLELTLVQLWGMPPKFGRQ